MGRVDKSCPFIIVNDYKDNGKTDGGKYVRSKGRMWRIRDL